MDFPRPAADTMIFNNHDNTYRSTQRFISDPLAIRHSSIKNIILLRGVNFACHLSKFLASLFIIFISSSAAARLHCDGASPDGATLNIGTVTWPASVAAGDIVKILPSQQFSIKCFYSGDPINSNETNFVQFQSSSATQSGSDDIFLSDVQGTGVRYSFSSTDCTVPDPILKKNTPLKFTCPIPGDIGRTSVISVKAALIATGSSVVAGQFTSAAIINLAYIPSDTNYTWPQRDIYSGSAQGALVASTCSVLSPSINVPMPNVSAQSFQAGIGTVSGHTPFTLKYSCAAGAQLYLTLTDNVTPTNRTSALTLAPGSTASGAGVQIANSTGPISFGPDSAEAGVVNQWNVGASPDGVLNIPLDARYVRTGVIIPGSVKAFATFTMSIQ
jgi:type 1 fimbria pilin